MLIAVKKNQHQRIFDILEKWDLKCSIIGEFIEGNEVQIFDGEKIISQTSIEALTSPPEYDLSLISKGYKNKKNKIKIKEEYKNFDKKIINKYLFEIMDSNNLISKESIYRKYDHHVQTNTVVEPGSDAAVIRIKGTDKYLIFSCDGNSRFSLGAGLNFTFLKKNDAYFDYAVVVEPHSVSQGLIHVFTYAFDF